MIRVATVAMALAITSVAGAEEICRSWDAVYKQERSDGVLVTVEFLPTEGSAPGDVIFQGHIDDELTWRHIGTYWCYLGSGGCALSLTHRNEASEFSERPIVFANGPNHKDPPEGRRQAADMLVVGGLFQDFWYGTNTRRLEMDVSNDGAMPSGTGPVFYFDSCRS